MNIEQAKAIPIARILEQINLQPTRKTDKESWYLSPLRHEKTASFHVHDLKNVWFDFGEGIGGDNLKLVQAILNSQGRDGSVSEALFWLKSTLGGNTVYQQPIRKSFAENKEPALSLKSVKPISNVGLIHYLDSRGIPLSVAQKTLKQVSFTNSKTGKTLFALGLPNEEEGYELRNPFFKGSIGIKTISFIRGSESKPPGINFFEGMMDYLSILTRRNGQPLKNDSIVLNSVACIPHVMPYLTDYGYTFGYTWMDNDQAGKKADRSLSHIFKANETIAHCPMNRIYQPHKDVNAWHMHRLER